MATREENLKKINDELEKVAGGVERIDLLKVDLNQKNPADVPKTTAIW